MKIGPKHIPAALYRKVLAVMPVPCVDLVIVSRGKFLLGKRKNKPAQGVWWFVGGRVYKNENLEAAALRHMKTETGIARANKIKQLVVKETIFKNSAQGPASHTINTIFLMTVPYREVILPKNSEASEFQWFSKINPRWPNYVKYVLRVAGFLK